MWMVRALDFVFEIIGIQYMIGWAVMESEWNEIYEMMFDMIHANIFLVCYYLE